MTTICGHRLLIVEDEPMLRITMADALRKEGWTVDVAEDGVKGIALFEQHLHDVVLTDLVMPRMGGHRAAQADQGPGSRRPRW